MTRFSTILLAVLGVQLALAAGLSFSGSDFSRYQSDEPLIAFDKDKVDAISIGESGGASVELVKKDGRWLIPSMADFPANQKLAAEFLDKVGGLQKGWPVATTSDAAERFKLDDDNYERKVVLKSGGEDVAELMIGSSPGFRKANVRIPDENEIYSVEIATYDAGVRGEEWMNRDFLDIERDKITSISIGDVKLEKKDGKLTLADLKDGETVKETELPRLINAVVNPAFDAVNGKGDEALAKLDPADFEVKVEREGGDPLTYRFKKEEGGGAYLYASSAHPYVFRVSESSVKALAEAKHANLVQVKVEEKKEEPPADAPVADNPATEKPNADTTGG